MRFLARRLGLFLLRFGTRGKMFMTFQTEEGVVLGSTNVIDFVAQHPEL